MDRVLKTLAHPRYELMAGGQVHDGVDEVQAHHERQIAARGRVTYSVVKLHHADDAVIVEYEARRVDAGADSYLPALAIFQFDGDGLVGERVYYDAGRAAEALG